jgi:dTDP-4-dehydrorhamnose reductase
MARNAPPAAACQECGSPATRLCVECVYDGQRGTLCEPHAAIHPHDDYGGAMALVNSPRVGLCGYEGPADPPY